MSRQISSKTATVSFFHSLTHVQAHIAKHIHRRYPHTTRASAGVSKSSDRRTVCGVEIHQHDLYGGTEIYSPVYLATPLKVISSTITGSERPFAFAANRMIRYEVPGSRLSKKNCTGGCWKRKGEKQNDKNV